MVSRHGKSALVALAAFAIFSSHDALIKALGGNYTSFQVIFFAVLFSFPLTTLMLVGDRTSDTLRPHVPFWTYLRTAAVVVGTIAVFYAFSALPLTETYAILFTVPLLITALSVPLLGETVRFRRWLAVAAGLGGVLVVLQPGNVTLSIGHGAALLAAICSALASVIVRKIGSEERSVVLLVYPMLGQFVLMGAVLPWVYVPMTAVDMGMVALVAVFGLVAMRMMIHAYRGGEASVVAPMQYSQIIWAAIFGYFFFGEIPQINTAIGAAIIIASGLYILLREGSGASSNRPVLRTRSRAVQGTHPRIGAAMQSDAETVHQKDAE